MPCFLDRVKNSNVHETFLIRIGRLLNVLYTLHTSCVQGVSMAISIKLALDEHFKLLLEKLSQNHFPYMSLEKRKTVMRAFVT